MKLRTIVIGLVVLGAAGAGLYWAFQPQPIGVDLAVVEKGTLTVTVDDEGAAQIRDIYEISTPIGGDVQRIPFTVGDHVARNEVVAEITPQLSSFLDARSRAQAEAAVKAAEAAVTSAKTDVGGAETERDYWQGEVTRTKQLFERGLATQQALDSAEFSLSQRKIALETAKAVLELRQRELDQAQAQLLEPDGNAARTVTYSVKAPAAGQVLEIANESARSLAAGAILMKIGNPRDLEVVTDLLSTDAVKIKAGAPATIDGWGEDIPLTAEVRRIEPIGFTKTSALGIEEQRVRVHLDILTDPKVWRALGHMYRVMVHIQTERVDDAVLVPTAALFRKDNEWAVFTVANDHAHLQPVALGARDATQAVATKGLEAGDKVILHPNDRTADGTLVSDRAVKGG